MVTVNSATSGLSLAYRLLNVCKHDEVISTPLTCLATTCAILPFTDKIIWADTDPKTCNIDLDDVQAKITDKTKVISFVHWAGVPVNMDKIKSIQTYEKEVNNKEIFIVEDCAHAFGAEWDGMKLGANPGVNSIAVYSFQAIKHLTTGDGGVMLLPNKELYDRARLLRWYGIDRKSVV